MSSVSCLKKQRTLQEKYVMRIEVPLELHKDGFFQLQISYSIHQMGDLPYTRLCVRELGNPFLNDCSISEQDNGNGIYSITTGQKSRGRELSGLEALAKNQDAISDFSEDAKRLLGYLFDHLELQ
ncbi:hypothetical protein HN681_00335 [archaeon]|jgi:hypothetical protein|nr:hypothetical protein [archaeon]MBT3730768.1 hypothetical protein [archaeon]MBT4669670.1 hypothetical protein [archaeon]MBT5030427.1 hypothetical protein [archaeon]MBT5288280.1 hypothetical protein [archaeon]